MRAHSTFEFGVNFSRASAGRIATLFMLWLRDMRWPADAKWLLDASSVLTKQLTFVSEEDASSSEEDTDSSVPLDYKTRHSAITNARPSSPKDTGGKDGSKAQS